VTASLTTVWLCAGSLHRCLSLPSKFVRRSFDVRSSLLRRSFVVVPSSSFLRRRSFDVRSFVPSSSFLRRSFVVPLSFLRRLRVSFRLLSLHSFVCLSRFSCVSSFVAVVCPTSSFVQRRRLSNVVVCPTSSFVQRRRLSNVVVCPASSIVQRRRLSAERHKKSYSFDLLLRVVIACGPVDSSASPVSAALVESI